MRDRQLPSDSASARIPIFSSALHFVAMTALVYLRSSFGYLYFRPRAVFFAVGWALTLFSIYAWSEPFVWRRYWAVVLFGLGSMLLYLVHFVVSVRSQFAERAEMDTYSGTSHLLRILGARPKPGPPSQAELRTHLYLEPLAILVAALVFRFGFSETKLSAWLLLAAVSVFLKEFINYWQFVRRRKRQDDVLEEAQDMMEGAAEPSPSAAPPPEGVRKRKAARARSSAPPEEERYAQALRLWPPYTLVQAEANYRRLIAEAHPDHNADSPESNVQAALLNEAIAYFRKRG